MTQNFSSLYPSKTREADLGIFLSFVKSGGGFEVVGMQGVGRTVFLGLLSYNRGVRTYHLGEQEDMYHFVMVDFTELKRVREEEVWKTLFVTLVDSLQERKYEKSYKRVKELFADAVSYHDGTLLFQGFKSALDFLLHVEKLSIIFLLDTFEAYAPSLQQSFFDKMRVLEDRYRYSLTFVFSSSHPLSQLVSPEIAESASHFISDHTLYLALRDEVGLSFLVEYLQEHFGKKVSKGVVEVVLMRTGGHAKMVKAALEEILTHDVGISEVEEFLGQNTSVTNISKEIWQDLFPRQQLFLRKLIGRNKILNQVQDDDESGTLKSLGIIDEKLGFSIPLFEEFVKSQLVNPMEHSFEFHPGTGEILKGDVVISDLLTKNEYKLLRYFLEQEGNIVSRDEIATAGWGDEKAKEGISDQAIDQLVFRLRHKIEDDPITPHHIVTVKGRGFQFKAKHDM